MEELDESTRLLVLKLARCNADKAEPILLGLGRAFSLESDLLTGIFGVRENSLDFAFSDLEIGFSSIDTGIGGGSGSGEGGGWLASFGEVWPDRGNTTLAAVVATAELALPSLSICMMPRPPFVWPLGAVSADCSDGCPADALLPLLRRELSPLSVDMGTVCDRCRECVMAPADL